MAWNNGFPATYQQTYPQGYPMTQNAAYAQQMAQTAFQQPNMQQPQQQPTPMMTPPTIRAEIIQIDDEGWENYVDRFPLGPGASQMFMTRSEGNIIIKSMGQTGPLPLVVFDKRPPEPPAPAFDPAQYVRKDEINELVSAAIVAQQAAQATVTATVAPKRTVKKEEG